jgi:hypothetical protein
MTNLKTKLDQVIEIANRTGKLDIGINPFTGTLAINGVQFSLEEQYTAIQQYSGDEKVKELFEKLNSLPIAKDLRGAVTPKADGGFDVRTEQITKALDRNKVSKIGTHVVQGDKPEPQDEKDAIISELKQQIKHLKAELSSLKQKDKLHFPGGFEYVSLHPGVEMISDEQIQEIIDELEQTPVPEGSFVIHRIGNVAVMKFHDAEGITYIVADDYFYANK